MQGFTHTTCLDVNMGYYTIPLDKASMEMCTIILPWGKYCYELLPQGFAPSSDIFQEIITNGTEAVCHGSLLESLNLQCLFSYHCHPPFWAIWEANAMLRLSSSYLYVNLYVNLYTKLYTLLYVIWTYEIFNLTDSTDQILIFQGFI